jgi:hypothetical protein
MTAFNNCRKTPLLDLSFRSEPVCEGIASQSMIEEPYQREARLLPPLPCSKVAIMTAKDEVSATGKDA